MHYNMANLMQEEGDLDGAAAEYEKALELDPKMARAHKGLGLVYSKQGMLDKAISQHQKALEIDPNLPEAHKNLGTCYNKKGLSRQAAKEFSIYNKVVTKEPTR